MKIEAKKPLINDDATGSDLMPRLWLEGLLNCVSNPVNFPVGFRTYPVCPHFDFLAKIAEELGVKREGIVENGRTYCGHFTRGINDLGVLCGRSGTEFIPSRFCTRLLTLLELIRDGLKFDPDGLFGESNELVFPFGDLIDEKKYTSLVRNLDRYRRQVRILSGLEAAGVEMTREDLVTRLTELIEQLKDQLLDDTSGIRLSGSIQCPIAPKPWFNGVMS